MLEKNGESCVISPPQELIIKNIVDFTEALKSALEECSSITLNLSQVTDIDTTAIQALVALKNEALLKDIKVILSDMSLEVNEMLSLYNVKEFIHDKGVA